MEAVAHSRRWRRPCLRSSCKRHDNVIRAVKELINRGAIKQPKILKRKMESGRSGQDYLFDGENGKNDAITVMYRLAPKYVGKLKAIWENPEPVESPPAKPALALVPQVAPPIIQGDGLTMSSLEIAELTKKDHKHVMRDIRNMLEDLGITEPKFGLSYKDATGRSLPCFSLPRDLTETLITGYSAPLRHAVVVRLRELEGKVAEPAFKVPTTLHGALLLAANLEEQRQALTQQVEVQDQKIAEDKPKVTFFDITADTKDLQSAATVAGTINTDRSTTLLQVARPWNCTTRRSGKSGSIYKRSYRHFTED